MRTLRYWARFSATFLKRFKRILFASIFLGILGFLFYSQASKVFSLFNRGEVIGIVGKLSLTDLPSEIQSKVSLGLTTLDENDNVKPGIATYWESQEEGRVWIFKLGDYTWQDGSRIRASDINYQFSDVTKEILDDRTIKFTLKDPFAPFPSVVSRPIFKQGLLGAGEWEVQKLSSLSSQLTQSIQLVSKKTGKKQTYRFYQTEDALRTAYKLGQINKLVGIMDTRELSGWPNSVVEEYTHEDRYVGIFINTEDPILSSKSARQALAYAINKDNFPQKRAISPISPNSWAFNPQVKQYNYNLDRSRELLKTLPEQVKKDLNINLVTSPSLLHIADKIKSDWEVVGVKTHIQVSNAPPQSFQTFLAIQAIPYDPDQYSFWHSTQTATNITRYSKKEKESQRIDKLLEDGRKTLDAEERKKIYFDFQRFLLEDLPVIPLFHPVTYTISRK